MLSILCLACKGRAQSGTGGVSLSRVSQAVGQVLGRGGAAHKCKWSPGAGNHHTACTHPISLGIVLIMEFKWDRGTTQTHLGSYGLFLFCTIILFPYTFHSLPLPKQYIFGQIVEVTVRKDDAAFIVIQVQELPILIFCAKCRCNKKHKLQFAQLGRH